jgi:PAS domain S-box-containing protein
MKLRAILVALSLLAVLSVPVAGYFYYLSLQKTALKRAQTQTAAIAERIGNRVSAFLSENLKTVRVLAQHRELQMALVEAAPENLVVANQMLDLFQQTLGADVCYLMNASGLTVASSNRDQADSFVGKNYAFRPYFQRALKGHAAIYMALGVTSGKRGVYYGFPVSGETGQAPRGVAVIKSSIDQLEKELSENYPDIWLLTAPNGVIFASNQRQWQYHVLQQLSDAQITAVTQSRQFGQGPWPWSGVTLFGDDRAEDQTGQRYLRHAVGLEVYPDWKILILRKLDIVAQGVSASVASMSGYMTLIVTLVLAIAVYALYRMANSEINRRKEAEADLRESEEVFRSIGTSAQDAVVLMDSKGFITFWNPAAERIFGYTQKEALGQDLHALLVPQRYIDGYQSNIDTFRKTGQGGAIEKTTEMAALRKGGEEFPIELSLSAVRLKGKWHAVGIVRDISERQQAEQGRLKVKKLEGVLETAGGICHELNQPLQSLSGYSDLLLLQLESHHPLYEKVKRISEQVKRLGRFTRQLMGITHYQTKKYPSGSKIIDIEKSAQRKS